MSTADGLNFADIWEAVAAAQPGWPALAHGHIEWSWREFNDRASRLAVALLDASGGARMRVAVHMRNCPAFAECLFACFKGAGVPVPTNYRYRGPELGELWSSCDVTVVAYGAEFRDRVSEARRSAPHVALWVEVPHDPQHEVSAWAVNYEGFIGSVPDGRRPSETLRSADDVIIKCTGGTTGRPKGVVWRHGDLFRLLNRHNQYVRYDEGGGSSSVAEVLVRPGPVLLPASPLVHGTAMMRSLSTLSAGGSVVTLPTRGFRAEAVLEEAEARNVSVLTIVGDAFGRPIVAAMRQHPGRWGLAALETITSSGARWSSACKRGLLALLPQVTLVETLGATETTGMAVSVASTSEQVGPPGVFTLGEHARVLDGNDNDIEAGSGAVGRIVAAGEQPLGFYKEPKLSRDTFRVVGAERYSYSGDLAVVLPDGKRIRHLGRVDDCVSSGGEKVHPGEVDDALRSHHDVLDAAAAGVPDEQMGERVAALVVLRTGRDTARQVADVQRHVAGRLATYKVPQLLFPVPAIRRSTTGKVDRAWVRAMLHARAATARP